MTVTFFGCIGQPGHGFWSSDHRSSDLWNAIGPWDKVDGTLTPKGTGRQGAALLHHLDGWTALAIHDFTGDRRPGSNSVFFVDAPDLTVDEVLTLAGDTFPKTLARIGPVFLATSEAPA